MQIFAKKNKKKSVLLKTKVKKRLTRDKLCLYSQRKTVLLHYQGQL